MTTEAGTLLTPVVVRTARGRIEAAVVGTGGPAVLVAHGTPGDWRQARALAHDMSQQTTVVLPSRPGYGRTRLRVGRTPQEQAAGFVALLDALEIDRAVVVGISGGGPSAFAFAQQAGERCAGLVLCCAVAAHVALPHPVPRVAVAVPGLWRAAAALGRVKERRGLRDVDALHAEMRASLLPAELPLLDTDPRLSADLLAFAGDRVEAMRGGAMRNDVRHFLATMGGPAPRWPEGRRLPAVVMHGDADPVVPVEHAHAYAACIPGARLTVVPGYGHVLPATARDALAAAVSDVVAEAV